MITLSPMRIPLCPLSRPREEDGDYLVTHEDSIVSIVSPPVRRMVITLSSMRIPCVHCLAPVRRMVITLFPMKMSMVSPPREEDGDYLIPHEDVHGLAHREEDGDYLVPH